MRGLRAETTNVPSPPAAFTPRELSCLERLVSGLTDQEIARDLSIAHGTVRFHLEGARRKVGARSRTHLAALAVALGVARPQKSQRARD